MAILLVLYPFSAFAESAIRNPVEFLRKKLIDVRVGPGYTAYENFRAHSSQRSQSLGAYHGPVPLYDVRIGPVNISNIFEQAGFTKGRGPRVGLLITYTGDAYQSESLHHSRVKTLFVGGFVGYNALTIYGYTDFLDKHAGSIFAARFAPSIVKIGGNELFLIFELEHMNRMYVDYYFGIRNYEANSVFSAYDGVRTNNYSLTLSYVHTFSKKWEFLLWGGEKRYGIGVTNSPTVGLKHAYRAGIGFLYRPL